MGLYGGSVKYNIKCISLIPRCPHSGDFVQDFGLVGVEQSKAIQWTSMEVLKGFKDNNRVTTCINDHTYMLLAVI